MAIQVRSREHLMSQMVASTKIASGVASGQYYPLCYGQCWNVQPLCTDTSNDRYYANVADVYAFNEVRESGNALSGTGWGDNGDGSFDLSNPPEGMITCDVQGMMTGGSLINKIKEIVTDVCITRGPFVSGDFDTTTWTSLNTTFPQTMGLYVAQPRPICELMDEICASVGAFYYIDRDGKIVIKQFNLSGTSILDIGVDQIAAKGLSITGVIQPMDKVKRGYARNWAPQSTLGWVTDTADASGNNTVTSANREKYERRHSWVLAENAGAANILKRQEPPPTGTLLTVSGDASTEATRWAALWTSPRVKFGVNCFLDGARINLGDRVKITHPRYGLADGVTGTVITVTDRPTRRAQYLEVMT
jgi:hypothetical protein